MIASNSSSVRCLSFVSISSSIPRDSRNSFVSPGGGSQPTYRHFFILGSLRGTQFKFGVTWWHKERLQKGLTRPGLGMSRILKNELKLALKQGKIAFGAGVTIGHPDIAEILALQGYDWIFFDCEHSVMNEADVQRGLQAIRFSRAVPLVRVAWNDMIMIKKMLDVGVYGIIVPWINTKEDAIKAVQAMRYPPQGMRGFGPRRASMGDPDYVSTANGELFLGIQIETQSGVDNLDDILSVEGIDATLIGPNDLTNSLGIL